jgi:hypothetical protein
MEEFDIDLSDIGGTSINNLYDNNLYDNKKNTELDNLKIERNKLVVTNKPTLADLSDNNVSVNYRPKKNVNMNKLIENLESDLKKYSSDDILNNDNIPVALNDNQYKKKTKPEQTRIDNITKTNDIVEILIYVLVFMILNNKFIIDIIHNYVPYMKIFNNTYPNLVIRSCLFGFCIYLYKKYYTNN